MIKTFDPTVNHCGGCDMCEPDMELGGDYVLLSEHIKDVENMSSLAMQSASVITALTEESARANILYGESLAREGQLHDLYEKKSNECDDMRAEISGINAENKEQVKENRIRYRKDLGSITRKSQALASALSGLLDSYVDLVDPDVDQEQMSLVIAAREALKL